MSQYEWCDVEMSTSKFTLIIDNKITMKSMTFIRIGTKSSSSYKKLSTQYNTQVFPPLIIMRLLSNDILNLLSTDVIESINWSENERVSIPYSCNYIFHLISRNLHLHLHYMIIHQFFNLYILF